MKDCTRKVSNILENFKTLSSKESKEKEETIPKLLLRKSSLQPLCFVVYDFEAMILVADNQSKVEKLRNSKDNLFPQKIWGNIH